MARTIAVLVTDIFYLVMIAGLLRRYPATPIWIGLGLLYVALVNIALWIYLDPKRHCKRAWWRSLARASSWVIVIVAIPGIFQQAVLSGKISHYLGVVYAAAIALAAFHVAGRSEFGQIQAGDETGSRPKSD